MQEFYDDAKKPTLDNIRIQAAAGLLEHVLTLLGKEVPASVIEQKNNQFAKDVAIERTLLAEVVGLLKADMAKGNELLDGDNDVSRELKAWWVNHHEARRDYSVEPMRLATQVVGDDGCVPVYHIGGEYTHWIQQGTSSWPDPESRVHELRIPAGDLVVMTASDAGGDYTYLVRVKDFKTCTTYDIVRINRGELAIAVPNKPSFMPTYHKPVEKPPVKV